MTTGQLAEQIVKKYFLDERRIELIKASRGELGYDFRDRESKLFVEVKGTKATDLTKVLFRSFTNTEYEKARSCRKAKLKYEIHLIVGIETDSQKHYLIPRDELLEKGKPEVHWTLPIRKEYEKYKIS